jgi:hypothetical protein
MKRLTLASVTIAMLVAFPFVGIATAAPANTTSVTLSCDKNVNATVTLILQPSQSDVSILGGVTISCGPNSNVARTRNRVDIQTGTTSPGWATITSWTNSTDPSGGCPTGGTLAYKATCTDSNGLGSQLVVR